MNRQEAFRALLEAVEFALSQGHTWSCERQDIFAECTCWYAGVEKAFDMFKATVGTDDIRLVKFTQSVVRPPITFDEDDPSQW